MASCERFGIDANRLRLSHHQDMITFATFCYYLLSVCDIFCVFLTNIDTNVSTNLYQSSYTQFIPKSTYSYFLFVEALEAKEEFKASMLIDVKKLR